MRPEVLQSMLYYYVKEKSTYDEVDGPSRGGNIAAEFDDPVQRLMLGGDSLAAQCASLQSPVLFVPPDLTPAQTARHAAFGRKLADWSAEFSSTQPEKSAFKFKNSCMFVSPEDQTVVIHVMRTPNSPDRDFTVKWKTVDRTAVSGTHYVDSVGELVFDKDSVEKEIEIQLIPQINVSNEDNDLRFQVQLEVENGVFHPKPATVNIKNINKYYDDEKQVLKNIFQSCCASIPEVSYRLTDKVNNRTFHGALSYICSHADSLPLEVGLAFEFSRLCLPHMRFDSMMKVLNDFFRNDNDEIEF